MKFGYFRRNFGQFVCVRNGSASDGGGQAYCVDSGATAAAGKIVMLSRFVAVRLANPKSITISGLFPFFNIGCLGCGQAHPPANWTP